MPASPNFLEIRHGEHGSAILVHGRFDWVAASASADLLTHPPDATMIDMAGMAEIDTVGALFLTRLQRRLGNGAAFVNVRPAFQRFLTDVAVADAIVLPREPRISAFREWVEGIGAHTIDALRQGALLVAFLGKLSTVMARIVANPRRLRVTSIFFHIQDIGLNALPITALLAVLMGIVLTYQGADQLSRFGATIYVVNLLGVSILRELGPLITAIIVAGRSGSAFTAEIGTMTVNQEIDALRTMGIDPVEVLVVPRIVALVISLPLLVFISDVIAILGGAVMARLTLHVPYPEFLSQFRAGIPLQFLWAGLFKAPVFALLIGMVGCFQGLQVTGSAESVGKHTTRSVVQSICLVIAFDAIFSMIFALLHY